MKYQNTHTNYQNTMAFNPPTEDEYQLFSRMMREADAINQRLFQEARALGIKIDGDEIHQSFVAARAQANRLSGTRHERDANDQPLVPVPSDRIVQRRLQADGAAAGRYGRAAGEFDNWMEEEAHLMREDARTKPARMGRSMYMTDAEAAEYDQFKQRRQELKRKYEQLDEERRAQYQTPMVDEQQQADVPGRAEGNIIPADEEEEEEEEEETAENRAMRERETQQLQQDLEDVLADIQARAEARQRAEAEDARIAAQVATAAMQRERESRRQREEPLQDQLAAFDEQLARTRRARVDLEQQQPRL